VRLFNSTRKSGGAPQIFQKRAFFDPEARRRLNSNQHQLKQTRRPKQQSLGISTILNYTKNMFGHPISFGELLLIFAIVFLLFGGKKLPELGKALGDGIRNFQAALKGEEKPAKKEDETKPAKKEDVIKPS
jgi:sec-independent protein translocase protein TatA